MTPRLAVAAILVTVAIFGSNFAVTRGATQQGFLPADLVALRFLVAGPIFLPFFLRRGIRTCAGLGWRRGVVLALTGGAGMSLLMNTGLSYAPAAHGAAMAPGTVTTIGVLYGIVAAGTRPSAWTWLGLAAILAGLASIPLSSSASGATNVLAGDGLFLLTGLVWGFYPILLHRWRVEPIVGVAIVSVLSLAYLPVYFLTYGTRLLDVPAGPLAFQAVFQGGLNVVVALVLWGHAVRVLGPARTQLFPPLIPVLGTLLAIPILGELPGPVQAGGLALIVAGIVLSLVGQRRKAAPRA